MRYRISQNESVYKSSLKWQTTVCVSVLAVLCVVRFTPDDTLAKTKNAIKLILTQQTDIKQQTEKIKNIFKREDELSAMNPVAEFVNPVPEGKISIGFGVQDAKDSEFHYGVDIACEDKSNVVAAAEGKITEIATNEEYGSYIIITHSDEISTLYAGLGEILPDIGESVTAGKTVARVQNDGILHFEIHRGDTYLNPEDFIEFGD